MRESESPLESDSGPRTRDLGDICKISEGIDKFEKENKDSKVKIVKKVAYSSVFDGKEKHLLFTI